ncbi:MAG: D-Ala-D-Ala carboxypeptidase family metallohydrolase [candidate division FCPU426 bacterium]
MPARNALSIATALALLAALTLANPTEARRKPKFDSGRASFSVRCQNLVAGYRLQAVTVLPSETVDVEALDADWDKQFRLEAQVGTMESLDPRHWRWTAPDQPGECLVTIHRLPDRDSVQLLALVLVPYDHMVGGVLNGYLIGSYPEPRSNSFNGFGPPRGFVEVREDNLETWVSPHFQLQQFLCRQAGDFPKYLVLDERLLVKLEELLAKVNLEGHPCRTLSISSAFRTPHYNRLLKQAEFSLHQWGQAADVAVDADGDGKMDDLNHNGKSDLGDVEALRSMVEHIEGEPRHQDKVGGLGVYDERGNHGPFVHIDVRGEAARWQR